MDNKRRIFLKFTGLAGLATASGFVKGFAASSSGNKTNGLNQLTSSSENSFMMNEKMKANYKTALNILKPSKKDLEHGTELHRNSVVIDAYGFMPKAAVDGALIAAAVNDNASPLELQDMEEDMPMTRFVINEKERAEFQNAWKAAGVTCVVQNAGEEGNEVKRLLKRLARFTYATDMMRDFVAKAVSPDDIIEAKKQNRHVLYLTGNGVPLPQEWVSVEEELRYIKIFYQLGIRMMHLTYNRQNMIGDGCGEPADGGLSDFGRAVIKEMNRVGVIVDIAHSGWRTSLEASQASKKPMVASHTVVAAVNKHIRAKPDSVIKAIADTGGYIGICCIPRFLGGTGDISAMMKHIDYVVKNFGSDYVAIGTDVAYTSQYAVEENKKIPPYRKPRTRWEALWPANDYQETPLMVQSLSWTNWPLFTVGMVQSGHSDEVIQKILGGNTLRVSRTVMT
jgi:membrane dipeptidase